MHADCEEMLLEHGSDLWGANWFVDDQRIEFESLINIRLRAGNRSMIIQSDSIQKEVETVTSRILGGA